MHLRPRCDARRSWLGRDGVAGGEQVGAHGLALGVVRQQRSPGRNWPRAPSASGSTARIVAEVERRLDAARPASSQVQRRPGLHRRRHGQQPRLRRARARLVVVERETGRRGSAIGDALGELVEQQPADRAVPRRPARPGVEHQRQPAPGRRGASGGSGSPSHRSPATCGSWATRSSGAWVPAASARSRAISKSASGRRTRATCCSHRSGRRGPAGPADRDRPASPPAGGAAGRRPRRSAARAGTSRGSHPPDRRHRSPCRGGAVARPARRARTCGCPAGDVRTGGDGGLPLQPAGAPAASASASAAPFRRAPSPVGPRRPARRSSAPRRSASCPHSCVLRQAQVRGRAAAGRRRSGPHAVGARARRSPPTPGPSGGHAGSRSHDQAAAWRRAAVRARARRRASTRPARPSGATSMGRSPGDQRLPAVQGQQVQRGEPQVGEAHRRRGARSPRRRHRTRIAARRAEHPSRPTR